MSTALQVLAALASDKRLEILRWLEDPVRFFPKQVDGDLETDGVCSVLIARRLKVSEPTTSRHMRILLDAGLVKARSVKQWTFYRRDERGIDRAQTLIGRALKGVAVR
ncbi:MAG: winged helix-turn-helix domain-containing protein [Gemmatimonadales bacterium]